MIDLINSVLIRVVRIIHVILLPKYKGSYFLSPRVRYISQFVGIYPSSIALNNTLTNTQHIQIFGAKNSTEFTFWAWRDCGIACVKMIIDSTTQPKKSLMELTHEGIKLGGYILYKNNVFVDKGWFHSALVALLKKYSVSASMKKWQSLESVAKDILDNNYVIISVVVPGRQYIKEDGSFEAKPNATFGGHLLLATGVKLNGGDVLGIYVNDPRGLQKYQENTYISKKTFSRIFTHRTIVTKHI